MRSGGTWMVSGECRGKVRMKAQPLPPSWESPCPVLLVHPSQLLLPPAACPPAPAIGTPEIHIPCCSQPDLQRGLPSPIHCRLPAPEAPFCPDLVHSCAPPWLLSSSSAARLGQHPRPRNAEEIVTDYIHTHISATHRV